MYILFTNINKHALSDSSTPINMNMQTFSLNNHIESQHPIFLSLSHSLYTHQHEHANILSK